MDERYRDRGLAIVGVAVQETTVDNVREYADRYGLGYPIAFDASADIFDLYRVYALPTQFFIGPTGVVRQVVNGPLTSEAAQGLVERWLPDRGGLGPGTQLSGASSSSTRSRSGSGVRPDRPSGARPAWHARIAR